MRSSYLWAGLIAVVIFAWFASGYQEALGIKSKDTAQTKQAPQKKKQKLFKVEVATFQTQMRPTALFIRGRTQVEKQVSVLARTNGIVEEAKFEVGDVVKKGDLLCRLDMRDRRARLAQAKASLISKKRDYEAAAKLVKRKFTSEAKLASDRAKYDAALAAVEQIQLDMSYTQIKAPINGVVTQFNGEAGAFLQPGKPCAVISVFNPILVVAQIGEREISKISIGMLANAKLVTGRKLQGKVAHISPTADISTRTFKVEVEVPNPGNKLHDGITAEVVFPLVSVKAHLIPAGIIGLNDKGEIGVKTLNKDNQVKFFVVKLIGQTRKGTWVQGLPEKVSVIIAGQDYVRDGQTVTTQNSDKKTSNKKTSGASS